MDVAQLLAEAHSYLDWVREGGIELDAADRRDRDVWFIQGALQSASERTDDQPDQAIMCFAFAVHLAETLAATCPDVHLEVEHEGGTVHEVMAVGDGSRPVVQNVLSWVTKCRDDPEADNIIFKYAGALRDFGETARAETLAGYLG